MSTDYESHMPLVMQVDVSFYFALFVILAAPLVVGRYTIILRCPLLKARKWNVVTAFMTLCYLNCIYRHF